FFVLPNFFFPASTVYLWRKRPSIMTFWYHPFVYGTTGVFCFYQARLHILENNAYLAFVGLLWVLLGVLNFGMAVLGGYERNKMHEKQHQETKKDFYFT